MGYPCKMQKIQRDTQNTYYVNIPNAIAEALEIAKGEVFEWFIEDQNTLVLQRSKPMKKRIFKNVPLS